jgi:hypothetical protein
LAPRIFGAPVADQQRGRMPSDADKPVIVKDAARPGVSSHNVRYVLVASLIGAILLMIVIAAISTH